jgi:gliding motility-associated-like protein
MKIKNTTKILKQTCKIKKHACLITSLFLIVMSSTLHSQGEAWNWNFGNQASLNFAGGGAPIATVGSAMFSSFSSAASISTPAGAIRFYTNGAQAWGANNIQMPNGFGLLGNGSTSQGAIIVPRPGNPNLYYIFANSASGIAGDISYSEVDMTLNGGFGDVTAIKNVIIQANVTEQLTACKHCNGIDFWVICHDFTNNNYYAFLVTASGVNSVPIISSTGVLSNGEVYGTLKVSPNGKKIAYAGIDAVPLLSDVEIADFNAATGVVSNAVNLSNTGGLNFHYGLEFSPNSQLLYCGDALGPIIVQWDLCGNAASIIASATVISGNTIVGLMQLGPDGKIYVTDGGFASFLYTINNPNTLGLGCNFVINALNIAPGISLAGLPNFISSYLEPPLSLAPISSTVSCLNASFTPPALTTCSSITNSISAYQWDFGDPASANNNTSTAVNPTHAYTSSGTYTVNLLLTLACGTTALTQTVNVVSCGPALAVNNVTLCSGGNCAVLTATASGGTGPYTYTWSPNIGSTAGPFTVCPATTTIYTVSITDALNVTASITSTVVVIPTPTLLVTPSSPTLCANNFNGSINTVSISASGATSYSWTGISGITSNTTAGAVIFATAISGSAVGSGFVTGYNGSCSSTTSFSVTNIPNPIISVPSVSICGSNATLTAFGASSYTWSPAGSLSSSTGSLVIANPAATTVYSIIGTSLNCNSETQTVTVSPQIIIAITGNQSICFGKKITLNAGGGNKYLWAPSESLNSSTSSEVIASPSVTTIYTVNISNNGICGKTATVLVTVNPKPQVFAGRDTIFNLDEPMFINATGTGTLTWVSGEDIFCKDCPETKINATQSGCYVIEAITEFGCKASDDVCVEITTNSEMFIPNSFTPNDDGLNDVFFVYGFSLPEIKIEIFDRWGEKVFSSNNQKIGWDGTYKGTACKSDIYVYNLSYKSLNGKKQFKTGHVSINR